MNLARPEFFAVSTRDKHLRRVDLRFGVIIRALADSSVRLFRAFLMPHLSA